MSVLSNYQYLTHYWPICDATMLDVIGSSNMIQGNLTSFTSDRFNNPNSALALNGGWTYVPSGIYFNTPEFTISVWVYPQQVGYGSRVIDFGNGVCSDSILLALDSASSNGDKKPWSWTKVNTYSNTICEADSKQVQTKNEWQFLTVTFNSTDMIIYINGTLMEQKSIMPYILPTVNRTNCYIGKSYGPTDDYSWSYLDDLIQ